MAFGDLFRRKKPGRQKDPSWGHRGVAARSIQERMEKLERGQQPFTEAEMSKWTLLTAEDIQDFLHNEGLLFVHSSNVVAIQYFSDEQKMMVEYKGGASYLYSSISPFDAMTFTQAASKGAWVWSNLRVRGSKTAHRKPYIKLN